MGNKSELASKEVNLENINWLGENKKDNYAEKIINIKVRARQNPVKGKLYITKDMTGKVLLDIETSAVSKGQGCVFYNDKEQLLGGGWIK